MVLLRLLILYHSFVGLKGLAWPSGTYGIPETLSGCPDEEGGKWKTGWRRQHLEKENQIPKPSHLNATLVLNGQGIERSFCIKTVSQPEERNTLWPAGKYCIYKYGTSCPEGLKTGSFHWDDVNDNNRNSYGGVLPEGSYDNDTTIKYCCQDSGDFNQPIDLPFDKPFYLLPYRIALCQHVKWTVRSLEKIVYDTENDNNNDSSNGNHALVKEANSLATAYYCYYKACSQTLRNATGSFSSYNRSHQYCSWAIVVKEYFAISLTFSELDIPDCQLNHLDIYEGLDEKGALLARYCGSNATRPVRFNSTRNTLFVVLKLGGNFDGLIMKFVKVKAEYSTKVNSKSLSTEFFSTQRELSKFKTTVKPSIETGPREVLSVSNRRKNSASSSNKMTIIVTASLTSFFVLLLIIFVGLYIRRSTSPFNGFLPKQRKESVNPIYEQTCESSSMNPLYSSTAVPIYEEAIIKKDILLSRGKDPVRTQREANEVHYETPDFK